jgi:hypothetical protein
LRQVLPAKPAFFALGNPGTFPMATSGGNGKRKRRPRSRVIADMSVNFLERQALRRGHRLIRIPEESDYDGTDALLRTHDPDTTFAEPGQVDFQLKATDRLRFVDKGKSVTCRVEMAHLHFWYWQTFHPFILVLYDAQRHRAFWLDVKHWVDAHSQEFGRHMEQGKLQITLRIPVENKLTLSAIDRFRAMLVSKMPPTE